MHIRRFHEGVWYECRPNDTGTFYIHWSEGRRSRRESTREKDVAAAQAYLDEWLKLLDAASAGRALTCADLWALKYEGDERAGYAWKHLEPVFGALRPAEVTQAKVDAYVMARRREARPSTIRYEVGCLLTSWNHAADRRRRLLDLADIPALDPLPPASPPRDRWLDDREIGALLDAVREGTRLSRVERFVWIALNACARRTAIQELRWSTGQIDFELRKIHFLPPGGVQTRKRRASVPMSDQLFVVLQRAHAERISDYVLDTPGNINDALHRVADRAGLARVTPHVLRHTAATHMARRGISIWMIAQLLGITAEVAEKVYAKFSPDFGREAVESIVPAARALG